MSLKALGGGSGIDPSVPLSPGVVAGPFVFVSGQVGITPGTKVVSGGFREQMRQALANVEDVLRHAGQDRRSIVRTTVYLTNVSDFAAMNDEYRAFFGDSRPARTTVGIAALAIEGLVVEVDAIALAEPATGGA